MHLRQLVLPLAAAACGAPATPTKPSPADTGAPLPAVTGGCAPASDHPLRLVCSFELDEGAEATLQLDGPDGRVERVVRGPEPLVSWGWPADSSVRWTLRTPDGVSSAGEARTGALPADQRYNVVTSGGEPPVDHLLFAWACGSPPVPVVFDTRRLEAVAWVDPREPEAPPSAVTGLSRTQDDQALVVLGRQQVSRHHFDGRTTLKLGPDQLAGPAHHDAVEVEGKVYALFAERIETPLGAVVTDGVSVHDGVSGERLATWHLADHTTPSTLGGFEAGYWLATFGPATDWSHANSLVPDAAPGASAGGQFLISLRHLSTVISVQLDPDAPSFGEIGWRLAGTDSAPMGTDFVRRSAVAASADFALQHHATRLADGRVQLFDNRAAPSEDSRVLQWSLDDGQAVLEDARPLPTHCAIQGGAFPLEDGSVLATCAEAGKAFALGPGGEVRWEIDISCPGGLPGGLVGRFIPFSLPADR